MFVILISIFVYVPHNTQILGFLQYYPFKQLFKLKYASFRVAGNDIHDAAIAWVENITSSEFTVYARALDTDPMYVNYVVYQKNIHTRTKGSLIGDSVLVNNFREATCTGDINEGVCFSYDFDFWLSDY